MLQLRRILSLVLAFACGLLLHKTPDPEIVYRDVLVPGPTQLVLPLANRGVEVSPGLRWLNVEADVPIFQVDNEDRMRAIVGMQGDDPGFVMGAYTHESEAIYILGTWTFECETALHEYTHFLERSMPDQAWRIRKAFHRLCSDKFRMDSTDLVPELPEPAPAIGIVLIGPPSPNPTP